MTMEHLTSQIGFVWVTYCLRGWVLECFKVDDTSNALHIDGVDLFIVWNASEVFYRRG